MDKVNKNAIEKFGPVRTVKPELVFEIAKVQAGSPFRDPAFVGKLDNQDKNMEIVFQYLDELLEKKEAPEIERKHIGFKQFESK